MLVPSLLLRVKNILTLRGSNHVLSSPFNESFNTLAVDDGLYTLKVVGKKDTLLPSVM